MTEREFIDGPGFAEWFLAQPDCYMSESTRRRLLYYRDGSQADLGAVDRILLDAGLHLSDLPSRLFVSASHRRQATPADRARALEMWKAGKARREIAAELQVSVETVSKWARNAGLARLRVPPETKAEAVRLYCEGRPAREVASKLDIATNRVYAWVREAGERVRPQGGARR